VSALDQRGDLLVFSHLRWDFVFQRPQHLLSRLATWWRIWFVEEPVPGASPEWTLRDVAPGITVCRPTTTADAPGFGGAQTASLLPLVRRLIEEQGIQRPVVWLETPLATPLLQGLEASLVVYDCMDELSAFLHAPPELLARERELLARAHLVFTGGPSLYRAKRPLHPRVYCFPSSVDTAHFARARGNCTEAPEQAALPRPRLGFAGVIDERFDVALLDGVAAARPDWQFVLLGPTVKIDPARVPQRPNITSFGMKPYAELPMYLTGWDVCLLPFARNKSTQFISPTKTLEYMAAGRPIVSTPIGDVAELYGRIVYLADGVERFGAACEQAMAAPPLEREARAARARAALRATSWDKTARRMHELLMARLAAGHATRAQRADQPC